VTDRHTDMSGCPMLCYSNGTHYQEMQQKVLACAETAQARNENHVASNGKMAIKLVCVCLVVKVGVCGNH